VVNANWQSRLKLVFIFPINAKKVWFSGPSQASIENCQPISGSFLVHFWLVI